MVSLFQMGSNYVLFPYMRRWKGKPTRHQDLRCLEGESAHLTAPCVVMELRQSQTSCSQHAHSNFHHCVALPVVEGCLTLLMYSDLLEILTFPARNRFGADKRRQWQDQNPHIFFFFSFFKLLQTSVSSPNSQESSKSGSCGQQNLSKCTNLSICKAVVGYLRPCIMAWPPQCPHPIKPVIALLFHQRPLSAHRKAGKPFPLPGGSLAAEDKRLPTSHWRKEFTIKGK